MTHRDTDVAWQLGKGELILVVDDELVVREISRSILESHNYRVVTANNGAEAVACYAKDSKNIHVVLIDMIMPIMDGPATIRAIQSLNPTVKIVVTSGLIGNLSSRVQVGSESGAVRAVLSKPYTAAMLLQTIHDLIEDKPAVSRI
jgi:two-component system, cell cycle sensor histidine kinase and response regulator CckA